MSDPFIIIPGATLTFTAGQKAVAVTGVLATNYIEAGDLPVDPNGLPLACEAVAPTSITLVRPAPTSGTETFIVYKGYQRAEGGAATAVLVRDVYRRFAVWADSGLSVPVEAVLNTPPSFPTDGQRWLIGPSPTGAWAGKPNQIVEQSDAYGGWLYAPPPKKGDRSTYNNGAGAPVELIFTGSAWRSAATLAADVAVTPVGGIEATNLQDALEELDTEKATTTALATGLAAKADTSAVNAALAGKLGTSAQAADSALLAGQSAAFYRNASNLNAGTVPSAQLPARLQPVGSNTTNWNTAIEAGVWWSNSGLDGVLNTPDGTGGSLYWLGHVIRGFSFGNGWIRQTLWQINGDAIFTRVFDPNTSTWGAWQRVRSTESDLDSRYARLGASNNFTAGQTFTGTYPFLALSGTDNVNPVEIVYYRQGAVRRTLTETPAGAFNINRYSAGAYAGTDLAFNNSGQFSFGRGGFVGGNFSVTGFLNANDGTVGNGTITLGGAGNNVLQAVNGVGLYVNLSSPSYPNVYTYGNWNYQHSLGVGTTPAYKFHVVVPDGGYPAFLAGASSAIRTIPSSGGFTLEAVNASNTLYKPLILGGESVTFTLFGGSYGLVSASTGWVFLSSIRFGSYGAGTLITDASGNVGLSSDITLKTNVEPWNKGLGAILALQPISHNWSKASGFDQLNRYYGFSAQDVEEVLPEAVGMNPNGFLTLSDRPLIGALVNAVKELNAKLEAALARIDKLENP